MPWLVSTGMPIAFLASHLDGCSVARHTHPTSVAGSTPEGVRAWSALAALQDAKAPPAPGGPKSSFTRCSLEEALVFESDAWQVELSKMTGAIVGLRFKGGSTGSGGSSGGSSGRGTGAGTGSSSDSIGGTVLDGSASARWRRFLSRLLHFLLGGWPSMQAQRGATPTNAAAAGPSSNTSWAAFNAPLALPVYSTYR